MAGYSATPLVKKLGCRENFLLGLVNPPKDFEKELTPLPAQVKIATGPLAKPLNLIILFADSQKLLRREFPKLARKLTTNGMLWIAWPKKSSGIVTDLSDNSVRQIGLEAGLVDVKVCAINEIWSGLKFVYRLRDRVAAGRQHKR
jgi:hypothetical protein